MPAALTYLAIMLAVIIIWFLLLKRPVYEAVLISFILLLTITGTWGKVGGYINTGLKTSLLYSMTAFCAMSILLTKTKVIDSAIAVILALLGRVNGGAVRLRSRQRHGDWFDHDPCHEEVRFPG